MIARFDPELVAVFGGLLTLLVVATVAGAVLRRRVTSPGARATVENAWQRIVAWWGMCAVFAAATAIGPLASTALFALLSFLALREFATLTPTRLADHATLVWCFFVILPLHYVFLAVRWYGMFAIFIPVYAFLFVPIRAAIAGDVERFLERTAKIQWGLMARENPKLLLWLVVVVQLSDVFQYLAGKTLGRRPVAPSVSPGKTWEGLVVGGLAATGVGAALGFLTPYRPLPAAGMALLLVFLGFAGGLTLSAIKRDAGVKDWGSSLAGHGGVLDRIDSLCFSAPMLFHLTRWFLRDGG
jgi:phosphatidate cytidylyltransferase